MHMGGFFMKADYYLDLHRAFFASKFEELQKSLFSSSPTIFPPSVFTADNFLWAVASVRRWGLFKKTSRCLGSFSSREAACLT